jgi:hypothetical protein
MASLYSHKSKSQYIRWTESDGPNVGSIERGFKIRMPVYKYKL